MRAISESLIGAATLLSLAACAQKPAPTNSAPVAGSASTGVTYFQPAGATSVQLSTPLGVTRYPESLRTARIEGAVVVQFVVDTNGVPLGGSAKVVHSTHPSFAQAVVASVPLLRFIPAEMNGRRIRQLVQQQYFFDVEGSATSRTRQPMPRPQPTSDPTNRNPMPLPSVTITVP